MRGMSVSTIVGFAIILLFALMALFGPFLAPYGESQVVGDVWEPFSAQFLLGTDSLGRDILTRLLWGASRTIGVALAAALLSFAIGMALGFLAAVVGGWIDHALSRAIDTLMAIPTLIFALVILSVLPPSVIVLILVIAVLDSTRVFRLSRAVAMDVAVMDFVEVARLRGEGLGWVITREVLPNTLAALDRGVRPALLLCLPVPSPRSASLASASSRRRPTGAAWCATMPTPSASA